MRGPATVFGGRKTTTMASNGGRQQNLLLVLALLVLGAAFAAEANKQPNFPDCMKNPFAASCRGISAKRSMAPRDQYPNLVELASPALNQEVAWQQVEAAAATSRRANQLLAQSALYQLLLPVPLSINLRPMAGSSLYQQRLEHRR